MIGELSMKKEILIFGIICLFLGVGIQPTFAVEITNISPSEDIEDCNCQVADNYNPVRLEGLLNRAKRLINRVEIFTKLMPLLYKDNPEVIEKCEELSGKITTYREMIDEELSDHISLYGSQSNRVLCGILEILFVKTLSIVFKLVELSMELEDEPIIYIISLVGITLTFIALTSYYLIFIFDCPLPPIPELI